MLSLPTEQNCDLKRLTSQALWAHNVGDLVCRGNGEPKNESRRRSSASKASRNALDSDGIDRRCLLRRFAAVRCSGDTSKATAEARTLSYSSLA